MLSRADIALALAQEMLRNSGVANVWSNPDIAQAISETALSMANYLWLNTSTEEEVWQVASKFLLDEFDGTPAQICFADFAGDFGPTAANDLRHATATDTQVQMAMTGLANGSYYQSAKVDLGEVRAPAYKARAAFEIAATPTAGNVIQAWWAPSASATAGTGNAGGVSGSAGAYTGYSSNAAASIVQLDFIGNFRCTAQATGTVQVGELGILVPSERYGSLVILNSSGAAFHSDDVEINIVFDPVYQEGQG